ncbi:glyoxalase superfamily protein [Paenibacillus hamazuiensis]|uniref:glyoxalase superfamily protein n=1 Tax=Paenibacillus hamazuiensis TaxID=2936508 RepID=UPI00200E4D11|nr:glyoxalase superfamily protein [Paenibacillus hamazuiensis]
MEHREVAMGSATPIIRIFDEEKAKRFYLDFLEFRCDWEHRFEENLPLYMQISLGSCVLHLSEHHGDACPGAAVRIPVSGIAEYHAGLLGKNYKYARPGLERTPWDTKEFSVHDPFGNRIVFYEEAAPRQDD